MQNKKIADMFYEIADLLEMRDVEWKPRAYRRAARSIESLNEDIADVADRGELEDIDGVGEDLAAKIREFLDTGELEYYQELKDELPVDVEALTAVSGLGPKRVKKLYQALDITDLDDLEQAAEDGEVADVEGFGETMQQTILDHIDTARQGQERMLLGNAFPLVDDLQGKLAEVDALDDITVVGSFRRRKPTVGDIDILTTSDEPGEAMDAFTGLDDIDEVREQGETKSSIVLAGGLQVDLRIVDRKSYGAALLYFTGSKDHNVTLRTLAQDQGYKLNEYGLFEDEDQVAGGTEQEVYDELGLASIEPELREDTGEIESAQDGSLPDLVTEDDIRGDLQLHTTYSDGGASIQEMAAKAEERGYDYILITDHGPSLQIAGGLDDDEIEDQAAEIEQANEETDITVLHGVEANITEDGLDISEERCQDLDMVVAAMHNRVDDPTDALVKALEDEPVDILAHPRNRKINEREPLDLDLDRVMEAAAANNVAIEINAQPKRLDLDWRNVKRYRDQVDYVVSTDAHSTEEMDHMHLGVAQARRGWCEPGNILNTLPLDELREELG